MTEKKEYYVRWVEEHEIRVEAEDEASAVREALSRSDRSNVSGTGDPIAIAA